MADNGVKHRHKPKRELAKKEIRRLLIYEGLSNAEISNRLQIPRRSLDRWIREIYQQDVRILTQMEGDREAIQEIVIFRERINQVMNEILTDIARNKDVSAHDRIHAYDTIVNIAQMIKESYSEGPSVIARRYRFHNNNIFVAEQEKCLVTFRDPSTATKVVTASASASASATSALLPLSSQQQPQPEKEEEEYEEDEALKKRA